VSDWIFISLAWAALLGGIVVAWRWGWRDTGKGMRRCPKCWYDMGATAGLKCSECGREAQSEKQLHRTNRKWRYVVLGAVLVLASYPIFKWPLYLKDGPIGFVPRVVTFAFLPEISEQIRKRLPKTAPSGVPLVQKLSKNSPLWIWERAILANSFARMLRDGRGAIDRVEILRETPILGKQVWIALPEFTKCVEEDTVFEDGWIRLSAFPFSPEYKPLAAAFSRCVARNPERLSVRRGTLELLRAWGATEMELHDAAAAAMRCGNREASLLGAMCLWRNSLTQPEDVPALLYRVTKQDEADGYLAAECLADLGPLAQSALEPMRAELGSKSPDRMLNASVILVAMGASAKPALVDFDLTRWGFMDESQRDAMAFAAGAIRGNAGAMMRPYSIAARAFGPRGVSDYFQVAALVYYSSMPTGEKVRQLVEIVEIGKLLLNRRETPVSLEFALVFLGKLGSDARSAVPNLIPFCEVLKREEVREAAADAILRIGIHSKKDAEEILKVLAIAGPPQRGGQIQPNPSMEWKLERLGVMALESAGR